MEKTGRLNSTKKDKLMGEMDGRDRAKEKASMGENLKKDVEEEEEGKSLLN